MGKVKKKQRKRLKWDELSEGGKMHLERRARNVCKGFLGSDAIRTNDRYEFKSYLLEVQEAFLDVQLRSPRPSALINITGVVPWAFEDLKPGVNLKLGPGEAP